MFDSREFRDALGRFATGVTIVTTRDAAGEPVGVTVSSYNSVSLDPPLVLWSLARTSKSLAAFEQSRAFAIHVLGRDQHELARRFATSGTDKFHGLDIGEAYGGVPLLSGCPAHFECETTYQYEGGDHVIFVGRVVRFDKYDTAPLLFHQGKFKEVRPHAELPDGSQPNGRFVDDFLPYLIGRAQMQLEYPIGQYCRELGMTETNYLTMGLLSLIGSASGEELIHRLEYTSRAPTPEMIADMAERGWIQGHGDGKWHLTPEGRDCFLSVLSRSRAMEEELLAGFEPELVEYGKAFLRMVIDRTGRWLPS